jgi:hypothetical protein
MRPSLCHRKKAALQQTALRRWETLDFLEAEPALIPPITAVALELMQLHMSKRLRLCALGAEATHPKDLCAPTVGPGCSLC